MISLSNYKTKDKRLMINIIILYLLNLTDLIFTEFLLNKSPELFMEANLFMKPMINTVGIYFFKIVIIAIVLFYWYFRSKNCNEKEMKRSLIAVKVLLVGYLGINLIHLFNIMILVNYF